MIEKNKSAVLPVLGKQGCAHGIEGKSRSAGCLLIEIQATGTISSRVLECQRAVARCDCGNHTELSRKNSEIMAYLIMLNYRRRCGQLWGRHTRSRTSDVTVTHIFKMCIPMRIGKHGNWYSKRGITTPLCLHIDMNAASNHTTSRAQCPLDLRPYSICI